MVKHERNIYCTVCGKTYVDFIAAQNVRICSIVRFLVERFLIAFSTRENMAWVNNTLYLSFPEMWESSQQQVQK